MGAPKKKSQNPQIGKRQWKIGFRKENRRQPRKRGSHLLIRKKKKGGGGVVVGGVVWGGVGGGGGAFGGGFCWGFVGCLCFLGVFCGLMGGFLFVGLGGGSI